MATKTFCDRCGRETGVFNEVGYTYEDSHISVIVSPTPDYCNVCGTDIGEQIKKLIPFDKLREILAQKAAAPTS